MKYYDILVAIFLTALVSFSILILARRPLSGLFIITVLAILLSVVAGKASPFFSSALKTSMGVISTAVVSVFFVFLFSGYLQKKDKRQESRLLYFGIIACIVLMILLLGALAGDPFIYLI